MEDCEAWREIEAHSKVYEIEFTFLEAEWETKELMIAAKSCS